MLQSESSISPRLLTETEQKSGNHFCIVSAALGVLLVAVLLRGATLAISMIAFGVVIFAVLMGQKVRKVHRENLKLKADLELANQTLMSLRNPAQQDFIAQIASGLAHEINNPMTIILGGACELERMSLSKQPVDYVTVNLVAKKIERMTERVVGVVRRLRELTRDYDANAEEPILLLPLLDESIDFCKERVLKEGVRLIKKETNPDIIVECHPLDLSKKILAMLNSAISESSRRQEKWVSIGAKELGNHVVIEFITSGPSLRLDLPRNTV